MMPPPYFRVGRKREEKEGLFDGSSLVCAAAVC